MPCQVTLLVSDELLVSMQEKFNVLGLYTGDINILEEGALITQLIFIFIVEIDFEDGAKTIRIELNIPGENKMLQEVPVVKPLHPKGTNKFILRLPIPVIGARIIPG